MGALNIEICTPRYFSLIRILEKDHFVFQLLARKYIKTKNIFKYFINHLRIAEISFVV